MEVQIGQVTVKTLMLAKTEGRRRREWQRMKWLDGITNLMDMSLSKLGDLKESPWALIECTAFQDLLLATLIQWIWALESLTKNQGNFSNLPLGTFGKHCFKCYMSLYYLRKWICFILLCFSRYVYRTLQAIPSNVCMFINLPLYKHIFVVFSCSVTSSSLPPNGQ